MKKFLTLFIALFLTISTSYSQLQIEPAGGCSGNLITTCSPFPEVKTAIFASNTYTSGGKVGLVCRGSSVSDYGIISAVEADNHKVFAGFTNQSGSFVESFIVYGNGKIFATEIIVQLPPFPDYVFHTNYALLPLNELKAFIKKNHHLPNIPSAENIKKNDVGLGELVTKQMEKIEELTLYILELNDRIDALEAEKNHFLKKQIIKSTTLVKR